ncbi:MAG: HDOD domain-containing protein [Desulfobulbaceae bacterium]|uniref:HDOD domain-containing protein n=1 Tax=Candidatus Desulfobia pelagia TaxID=2841692 RepID=A0A8J6NE61_9BACT|nr:HDOD domain-containing protein [Candidatus Desulfobia pelagia]
MENEKNSAPSSTIFIARQPIFRSNLQVYGYELLFRSGLSSFFDPSFGGDQATSHVITNSFLLIGIDKMTEQKKAFINFTEDMLLREYPLLFPNKYTVVEVLEDIKVTPEIIAACRTLVKKGYTLALDDFEYSPEMDPLLEIADIVKFDVLAMSMEDLQKEVEIVSRYDVKMLAEKVETNEQFEKTREMGFSLFQGYFFSKPNILQGKDIAGSQLQYLQVLKMIQDDNYDFDKIADLVSQDVSLAYKLLKYVNSAGMQRRVEIKSLQSAVAMVGEVTLRKWLGLIMLSYLAENKPEELLRLSIQRAAFCEQVGAQIADLDFKRSCYTVGMFSLLDVLLDQPMETILKEINLSEDITDTLLGMPTGPLGNVLLLAKAYERGAWKWVARVSEALNVNKDYLPLYFENALDKVSEFYLAS